MNARDQVTAPDPRLEEIESRLSKATPGPWVVRSTRATEWAPYYGVTAAENKHRYIVPAAVDWEGFGHGAKEADAEFIAHAPADIAYLLAELRKAQDKLGRVEGVHEPIDAMMYSGSQQRVVKVCTGCGTDDGNWQRWPCPTIRAAVADATGGGE